MARKRRPQVKPQEIRELLRLTGWSQAELARRLGMNDASVSRWLSGDQKPNGASILWMCHWLAEAQAAQPATAGS